MEFSFMLEMVVWMLPRTVPLRTERVRYGMVGFRLPARLERQFRDGSVASHPRREPGSRFRFPSFSTPSGFHSRSTWNS